MITLIKTALCELGIKEYRIISHSVDQRSHDIICTDTVTRKRLIFYFVFFRVDSQIYRIELSGSNIMISELRETVSEMIRHKLWYCDDIDVISNFDDGANPELQAGRRSFDTADFINLKKEYPICKRIHSLDTYDEVDVYTHDKHVKCAKSSCVVNILAEIVPGLPSKEITVVDPQGRDDLFLSLSKQVEAHSRLLECAKASKRTGQTGGRCLLSADITKTIISFFCRSLHGEQILFGSSFISPDCFQQPFLNRPLSIYKEVRHRLDGEGTPLTRKYYVKEGILISAFNDIRSAAYLHQAAGDALIFPDVMRSGICFDDIFISPCHCTVDKDLPLYDVITGNQFYYNPMTGELNMNLWSSENESSIQIHDNIVALLNRVESSFAAPDNASHMNGAYGLLIDLNR